MSTLPVTVEPDVRIFTYFALLNRHGYDLEGNPQMHPVRVAVRNSLASAVSPDDPGFQLFVDQARPFWPGVFVGEGWGAPCRSCDVLAPGSVRELWEQHRAAHALGSAAMQENVITLLEEARRRLAVEEWLFDSIRVVVNLLQSEWLAGQYLLQGRLWTVIGGTDPGLSTGVLHKALHMVIRPLLRAHPELVTSTLPAGIRAKATLSEQGYWGTTDRHGWYQAL